MRGKPKKKLSPFQEATKQGLPYLKLVIDERHIESVWGRIEIEGPCSQRSAINARRLIDTLLGEK
jgi:hypothetical protein